MSDQERAENTLSAWKIAVFAAPGAPLLALTLPTIIFLPPHFHSHLGLSLATVSLIFLGARALDIIIDPLVGGWQDRTRSALGRRRVWLGVCAPILAGLIWISFLGFEPGVSPALAGAVMMGLYFTFGAMMVAHLGWAGELVPTYHGRTRVIGAVQGAGMIGQVLVLMLAAYAVVGLGGSDADAVAIMGWAMIVALPLTVLATILFVRERAPPPQPHLPLLAALATALKNKTVLRVLTPDFLLGVTQGITGSLFLYYFQVVLGFERQSQLLLLIYFIAGFVGVAPWVLLGRAVGKHRALQWAFVYTAATTGALLFVPYGALNLAIAFMVAAGLAQGGGVLLTRALMADVVDEDELATGARRSGFYFGLLLTTSKVGLALGPLSYAVLAWAGFDPNAGAANTDHAITTAKALFVGAPIVLCLAAAASLFKYPLDEQRHRQLAAAIAARDARLRDERA